MRPAIDRSLVTAVRLLGSGADSGGLASIASTVVVVTGAGGQQGRAVAKHFAGEGANLVLADIDASALAETHREILLEFPDLRVILRVLTLTPIHATASACDQHERRPSTRQPLSAADTVGDCR